MDNHLRHFKNSETTRNAYLELHLSVYIKISSTIWWPSPLKKKPLHNKLHLTCGYVPGCNCSNSEQIGLTWALTLSPPLLHVSPMMTNEWGEAFFLPIAVSLLCCDTQRRMRLCEGGELSAGFGYICIEGLKNSPLRTYCTMYIHFQKCNLHFLHP